MLNVVRIAFDLFKQIFLLVELLDDRTDVEFLENRVGGSKCLTGYNNQPLSLA